MALRLTRIDEIYQAVDEKRPIQSASGVGEPIEAAIKAERVGDDISLGESDIRLGPIIVPMKSISALMSHILRGPKIIIGLHERDAGQISDKQSRYFLTAVMTGKMRSYSWVVDSPESIEEDSEGKDKKRTVEDMVTEMAHRISGSLKEESTGQRINWKAMWDYNEGLRAYRDGLNSARQHKYFLSIAERKFIDAIEQQRDFSLAFYNLGVVYAELNKIDAAESCFQKAIELNPEPWEAYYAWELLSSEGVRRSNRLMRFWRSIFPTR